MISVSEVEKLMKQFHSGQFDMAGFEYYKHPLWVKDSLPSWADDNLKIAALLHDSVEDVEGMTIDKLRELGVSDRSLEIIDKVTHKKNQIYNDYISRILESDDIDIITLKITDMKHNMLETRQSLLDQKTRQRLAKKYSENFKKLKEKIEELELKYKKHFEHLCFLYDSVSTSCFKDCPFKVKVNDEECSFSGKCDYTVQDYIKEKFKDKFIHQKLEIIENLLNEEVDICEYCSSFKPRYFYPEDAGDICSQFPCDKGWKDVSLS